MSTLPKPAPPVRTRALTSVILLFLFPWCSLAWGDTPQAGAVIESLGCVSLEINFGPGAGGAFLCDPVHQPEKISALLFRHPVIVGLAVRGEVWLIRHEGATKELVLPGKWRETLVRPGDRIVIVVK